MSAKFTPWTGAQLDWPVKPGGFAETVKGMTVYHDAPSRPYQVLGALKMDGSDWANPISKAVKEARKRGGDAIVVLNHNKYQTGTIAHQGGSFNATTTLSGNSATTRGSYSGSSWGFPQFNESATCIVIKYQ